MAIGEAARHQLTEWWGEVGNVVVEHRQPHSSVSVDSVFLALGGGSSLVCLLASPPLTPLPLFFHAFSRRVPKTAPLSDAWGSQERSLSSNWRMTSSTVVDDTLIWSLSSDGG